MKDKQFLMIPGPTPVPETALVEMAKHPLGHRSVEFSAILKEVYSDLKWLFQTKNDVFIYTASGTGALEGALSNIVNPKDKVLCLVIGNFGERWAKIAESRGAEVERMSVEFGKTISPDALAERLEKDVNKEIKVITLTHSETSTGAANPLKDLMDVINKHGAISVVDGVTSVGAMDVKMDEWGIDILVSGSQKGFMIPPGLSFLAASEKAMKAYEECLYPSFYFDFKAHKKAVAQDTTPYTPAVSLIMALSKTLKMMQDEGLENIFARHKKLSLGLRKAVRALGLELFVEDDNFASAAITSILPPEEISVADIRKGLKTDFDIVVADGQNDLKGKIFRMGTLGFVCERDVIGAIGALERTLLKLGYKFTPGSGVSTFLESSL
ncbi:MAG: alanine--glyoxylate aminotransferase family protein [Candidatus Gastranaerophilales bacterium]|nr:alanine--glyoxylate aminotransferase family protein [Candidatus Gastranaerophilales bacterium]